MFHPNVSLEGGYGMNLKLKPWYYPIDLRIFIPAIIAMLLFFAAICRAETLKQPIYLTASWYSTQSLKDEGTFRYSKGVMANGKIFDDSKFTCASRDFSLGSKLLVSNLSNNRSVVVRVTDRIGPRFKGKRIDLSKAAFNQIANLKQGIVKVKIERL
jgi:hypothetical protein